MSDKHYVITIERQYGSGGRITGMRLAEELGIHYYDEEILKMTSETSAIGEQYFSWCSSPKSVRRSSASWQSLKTALSLDAVAIMFFRIS